MINLQQQTIVEWSGVEQGNDNKYETSESNVLAWN